MNTHLTATVIQALQAARDAGAAAAAQTLSELKARFGDREMYDFYAGAVLHLRLRSNSRIRREMERVLETVTYLGSVLPGSRRSEMILVLPRMSGRQEQCVNIAAEEAALAVLKERLGIDGYVTSFES